MVMLRDFRYIIKRIIIGVGIALVLAFLRGNLITTVSAKSVLSHSIGTQVDVVNNTNPYVFYDFTGSVFTNRPSGTLTFSFSVFKVSGTSTSPTVMARDVSVQSEDSLFACSLGSTSLTNSTFGGTVYSVNCPVTFINSKSLKRITINLMDNQQNDQSNYRVVFNGLITYVSDTEFDTSGTTNAINNQTNAINNQTTSINNNINSNTNRIVESNNNVKNSIDDVNESINDDDVSDSEDKASGFFDDFESDAHGLSGVITAPLSFLQALTGSTCSPLQFQLPIIHDEVNLPCMKPIYQQRFGVFFSLWQLITTGLISYNVCLNFYKKIRDLQDPNNDRIEVLNL